MQCAAARRFIPAYLDGELDLTKRLEIETHLASCSECLQICEGEQALKRALKMDGLYFAAPPGLEARIRQSLPGETRTPAQIRWHGRWRSYGLAAAAALLLVFLFTAYRSTLPAQSDPVAQEVISSHVRSLMAAHLYDVRSTDKHTVKPWFNGKIDYAPNVEDWKAAGFPLLGGRMDYLNNRPVAALVYQRQKHIINVYLWPAAKEPDADMRPIALRGYHLWHGTKGGIVYWLVSDLNSSELEELARRVQNPPLTAK